MVEMKKVVVMIVCVVIFLIFSISTGGVGWRKVEGLGSESYIGLFRTCVKIGSSEVCGNHEQTDDKMKAVQAFMLLGTLTCIGALVIAILSLAIDKIPGMITGIVLIVAGICGIIAMAIFTDESESTPDVPGVDLNYAWAYGLGWVATIGSFVGAGVAFILNR